MTSLLARGILEGMQSFALALLVMAPSIQERTLNVFAAASLKESFTEISRMFETNNPGVKVRLNFAGSQTLAAQIKQGAPADLFASASRKNLQDIQFDQSSFQVFVRNQLQIAVRKGLLGIASTRDLSKVKNLVVADASVPAGSYTEIFFTKAAKAYGNQWANGVKSKIVSKELDVKAVLAKVKLGEADAGIVYASDVATAREEVKFVAIPASLNVVADYPVAVPQGASNSADAKRFIALLLEDGSQKLFAQSGFIPVRRK